MIIKKPVRASYHTTMLHQSFSKSGAAALALLVMSNPLMAQNLETPYTYNIPQGPLADSLDQVAREANITLSYNLSQVQGYQADPLNGRMTAAEALTQLVRGTDLYFHALDKASGTVSARVAFASTETVSQDNPVDLGTLTLDGVPTASGPRTLGAPPPAFPGGQVAAGSRIGLFGNQDVLDTPVSVTSYTDEFVRNTQAESPADLLRFEPGVNISQSSTGRGSFADSQSSLRGFTVFSGQATLDGLPGLINETDSITAFERVEVIRGASALLTGQASDDAIGGSINYVPKRALPNPLNRVTLSYRSDSNFGAEVDISRRFGENDAFGLRFSGAIRDGETSVDDSDFEIGDAALSLDYQSARFRAAVDLAFESRESTFDFLQFNPGFDIPGPPDTDQFVTPFPQIIDTDSSRILASFEYDVAPDWTLGFKAGYADTEFLFDQFVFQPVLDPAGNTNPLVFFLADETEAFAAEASLRGTFQTGSVRHQLTFTATYQDETQDSFFASAGALGPNNIFSPTPAPIPSNPITASTLPSVSDTKITNIAIADYISFFDDRLSILAGLRYTNIEIEERDTSGTVTSSFDDSDVTPAFGIAYKPSDSLTIYGNYIEALIPGESAPTIAVNTNETLPPIVSEQFEVGAKYDFGTLAATVALFQIERPSGLLSPDLVFSEAGLQRNRGIEFSVFGEPVEGTRLIGTASYIDTELTSTGDPTTEGNEAPGVPDVRLSLYGEVDVPQIEGLTLTGGAFFSSSSFLDDTNTQEVGSSTTFDIGARYATSYRGVPITAQFTIQNVGDSEHYVSNPLGGGLATLSTPRRVLVSVSADF
ncbi:MAG: TonB-dependent receptor [Pseudomonadota bacterium]